ncbi:MAG: alpha/beta fold hydrolase, partial [Chitinophagales bacterium]
AQQFAMDYPELTRAIVIVSSDAAFKDNPGLSEFSEEVVQLSDPVDHAFAESFQKGTIVRPVDSNYLNLYVNETMKVPARVWKAVMNGFMSIDYSRELYKIKRPVLIFWGDRDAICTKADQDILAKEISNAKLIVYEGTGHALHWEEPQRFADDLADFIINVPGLK